MAERVFLHLGVPKSGTTYLQTSMWRHTDELRARGVLLPGDRHTHHRWASYFVRGQPPRSEEHGRRLSDAWERVRADVQAWPGTAVVSHEFYGSATPEQAARVVAAFAPAQVHLVVTARNALDLLTAAWQETLKYQHATRLDDFNQGVSEDPLDVWGWRNLDPAEVLARWGPTVSRERVHVVVVPPKRTAEPVLWRRFAGLFLDDPDAFDVSTSAANESMGVVQCELLRRVCAQLDTLPRLVARNGMVRDYLAAQQLVPSGSERFHPGPDRVAECRARSERMVGRLASGGYHVLGELDDLLVPADLPVRRTPRDVRDDEVAEAATRLVAEMLRDLDATRQELGKAKRARSRLERRAGPPAEAPTTAETPAPTPDPGPGRAALRWVAGVLRRP